VFFRIKSLSDLLRITNEDKVRTSSVQQSFLTDYITEIRRIIGRKVLLDEHQRLGCVEGNKCFVCDNISAQDTIINPMPCSHPVHVLCMAKVVDHHSMLFCTRCPHKNAISRHAFTSETTHEPPS